ncbi:MAG: hypothetical protein IT304_09150 [Dehalococcoidia bacterium]|nr:hypothetical protein [Dehalococcoidia bacterium]
MRAVVLAIILAVSASVGLAGAATASAGPSSDAAGFWAWLIANSPAEVPADNCCEYGYQPCPDTQIQCPPPGAAPFWANWR